MTSKIITQGNSQFK